MSKRIKQGCLITIRIHYTQAVQRAVDIAEGGRQARPVTDAEAAKGRLDYVRVSQISSTQNPVHASGNSILVLNSPEKPADLPTR